jgi:hypothetical protein
MRDASAVTLVADAQLHFGEGIEHVELGDGEFREAVQPCRVAQHDGVEPARTTAATGGGAVLLADVDQLVAVWAEVFSGEGPGTHAGAICLGDTDDLGDVTWADAGTCARTTRHRVRRRDVGVRALVQVQEGGLRAFEQDLLVGVKGVVDEADGVGDIGRDPVGDLAGIQRHDGIDIERIGTKRHEVGAFGLTASLQRGGERGPVDHVART